MQLYTYVRIPAYSIQRIYVRTYLQEDFKSRFTRDVKTRRVVSPISSAVPIHNTYYVVRITYVDMYHLLVRTTWYLLTASSYLPSA